MPPRRRPGKTAPGPTRRRTRFALATAAALAAALLGCAPEGPRFEGPRFERVILIVVDTLRRDHVWPYNPDAPTPNVRRLAERGQVFTNALSSFHQTTMSMASLFTGETPSLETDSRSEPLPWNGRTWCGLSRLAKSETDSCVPQHLGTLAEDLREAGYWTIGVVTNVSLYRPSGYDQGFVDWVQLSTGRGDQRWNRQRRGQVVARRGERATQAAIRALERRPEDRFLLYVHYMDAHDWVWMDRESYAGGVAAMDEALGRLLDYLEDEDLLEKALVVFTADHGEMLASDRAIQKRKSHFGNPSFEPVLRVPLIVVPPTSDDSTTYVRSQDLRGLILRWLGRPAPETPQPLSADEQLLTEASWQTYRRWPWKSAWKREGDVVYLFDLRSDVPDGRDVSKEHPEVLRTHRARIDELAARLATSHGRESELTEEDLERLRALGYAE